MKYVSLDSMVKLWWKIMQEIGCPAVKAHSKAMCGHPHKTFANPCFGVSVERMQ